MYLYREIIANYLEKQDANIIFPDLQINAKDIVEMQCYKALKKIKEILEDESLDDRECFMRIEEIVCVFEEFGNGVELRHDFD